MQIILDLDTATNSQLQSAACAIAEEITNRVSLRFDRASDVWVKEHAATAESLTTPDSTPAGFVEGPGCIGEGHFYEPLTARSGLLLLRRSGPPS
jgi:hypothetical protein